MLQASPLIRRLDRKIEKNSATTGQTMPFSAHPVGNAFSRPFVSRIIHVIWEQRNGCPQHSRTFADAVR